MEFLSVLYTFFLDLLRSLFTDPFFILMAAFGFVRFILLLPFGRWIGGRE